jgi:hypothetical protein
MLTDKMNMEKINIIQKKESKIMLEFKNDSYLSENRHNYNIKKTSYFYCRAQNKKL